MKGKPLIKKQSKVVLITETVMQDNAHLSTQDIVRKRSLLTLEFAVLEEELTDLMAKAANVKARRTTVEAVIVGLNAVVTKR